MVSLKKKNILVAGGGGFLGVNLCESLLKEGHAVICLDNFSSGKRSNLNHLASYINFTVFEHDISDPIQMEVDEIYNMACVASPVQYQSDPLQTLRTSTEGITNLLKTGYGNPCAYIPIIHQRNIRQSPLPPTA